MTLGTGNSAVSLTIRLNDNGQWTGDLHTKESKILGDHGLSANWSVPIVLEPERMSPTWIPEARGAMDPIHLRLSQPVACESLKIDLVDRFGQTPAYTMVSDCDNSKTLDVPTSYTSRISLVPSESWSETNYSIQTSALSGLSGITSNDANAYPVQLAPLISDSTSLDFEANDAPGWFSEAGQPKCRVVSSYITSDKFSIIPESGSGMLSCEPATVGYSSMIGQFRVPNGSTTMSMMVGSRESAVKIAQLLETWELKLSNGDKVSLSKQARILKPEPVPTPWTGWHTVEVPLPSGASLVELRVGMSGCVTLKAPDQCMIRNHFLLDNISFR